VVTHLDMTDHLFVLHRRGPDIVVDFTDTTLFSRAGKRLRASDLAEGQRVSVEGILNGRIEEMVRTDRILIEG
jgi:hypothetical protein